MGEEKEKSITLILFSGEMDKALAALNLAVTAASMGKKVTIFCTFWGLNMIRKEDLTSGKAGFLRTAMGLMNRGGSRKLKMSRFNMGGVGKAVMNKLMADTNLPTVPEMIDMAKDLGVRFVACTTSIGVMGLEKQDFIPEVDEFAGAATYLGEADKSGINLFIS